MTVRDTVSIAAITVGLLACGDQLTTQEAYAACDALVDVTLTSSEDAFDVCVACYEDCGNDCERVSADEGEFSCPD